MGESVVVKNKTRLGRIWKGQCVNNSFQLPSRVSVGVGSAMQFGQGSTWKDPLHSTPPKVDFNLNSPRMDA
jgi:hypothetical protein